MAGRRISLLLLIIYCHVSLHHDTGSASSSSCSKLVGCVADIADAVDDFDCELLDEVLTLVFEECKVRSSYSTLIALKQIYEVWEDKDCEDDDDFLCSEEMECLEDLFDASGDKIDCGDDDDDILEEARECIEELEDDDSECEYVGEIDDILASDNLCDGKHSDSSHSHSRSSSSRYPRYYRGRYRSVYGYTSRRYQFLHG